MRKIKLPRWHILTGIISSRSPYGSGRCVTGIESLDTPGCATTTCTSNRGEVLTPTLAAVPHPAIPRAANRTQNNTRPTLHIPRRNCNCNRHNKLKTVILKRKCNQRLDVLITALQVGDRHYTGVFKRWDHAHRQICLALSHTHSLPQESHGREISHETWMGSYARRTGSSASEFDASQ